MQEKSIFIKVLRYGEEKGLTGFTTDDYKDWLISLPEVQDKDCVEFQRGHSLLNECFDKVSWFTDKKEKINHYILKSEYYFRLMEFQELQEAREAARSANRNSIVAISISVFAILASMLLSYMQTTTPITITEHQTTLFQETLMKNNELRNLQIKQLTHETNQILMSINEILNTIVTNYQSPNEQDY